eukprot:m.14421 g.14421  ORF g.14421 m.14421 type:complete len:64 (+) comp10273_c1_seq1:69-260(+)
MGSFSKAASSNLMSSLKPRFKVLMKLNLSCLEQMFEVVNFPFQRLEPPYPLLVPLSEAIKFLS